MSVVITAVILVVTGIVTAFIQQGSPTDIRRSVLLGLEIGLPCILYGKLIYRKDIGFYAAVYAKGWSRMTHSEQMHHYLRAAPMIFAVILAYGLLTQGHRIFVGPYLIVVGLLHLLLYPEQKAIWLAAKAKMAETEGSLS